MRIWLIVLSGDDATWVEGAWDDESTTENPSGWREAVDKARKTAHAANYEMRVVAVEVKGIYDLFENPVLTGEIEGST